MTNKRPTIKGKGADFFLDQDKSGDSLQGKATFYIPEVLIEKLDDVWVDLRKSNRKLKKSDIARIALEEILKDYEEKHQDSKLSEHFSVEPSHQH